jgi:hypothetical protein
MWWTPTPISGTLTLASLRKSDSKLAILDSFPAMIQGRELSQRLMVWFAWVTHVLEISCLFLSRL